MLSLHSVDSVDAPELAPYRTLRRHEAHDRQGIFVAQGDKVVARVLERSFPLLSVLTTPERFATVRASLERRPEHIAVYLADDAQLAAITGHRLFQGILAIARTPREWQFTDLLAATPTPRFLVAVDGLSNADNLGGVVRSAVAFGAQGLLVGETCSPPWLPRAVRASLGTILDLPVVRCSALADELNRARTAGVRCLAADPRARATLDDIDLGGDICIVLGSEGDGLRSVVRHACDTTIAIPIASTVESLNVSCAAAILFHQASRARKVNSM